jgi:hypothetical protein
MEKGRTSARQFGMFFAKNHRFPRLPRQDATNRAVPTLPSAVALTTLLPGFDEKDVSVQVNPREQCKIDLEAGPIVQEVGSPSSGTCAKLRW